MKPANTSIDYRQIEATQLDLIRPLWEKLKAHHVPLSPQFAAKRAARTFEARKQELIAKSASGRLRVDLAYAAGQDDPVAYCVTSLAEDGTGEIDSLYVEQGCRGHGIGTRLTQRALTWLDAQKAVSKIVLVAFGNESAVEFYRQFGFAPDNISLRQIFDAGSQPGATPNEGTV